MSGEVRLPMPPVKVEVTHQRPAVQFVGTTEEHYRDLGALWDRVLLTPAEDDVIRALGIIQPGVERLAYIGRASDARAAFGSFMVKFAGEKSERLPIGSMGDGMKRLLALSLHLVAAANGVLLVDEIDTGLHHSVLTKAWELTARTALANNTQVFATTHSLDCIRSLAWLCDGAPELRDRVSVHRIEADRPEAIRYSGHELITAIEHELEVR